MISKLSKVFQDLTQFCTVTAVNVEWLVTLVDLTKAGVKHKTIGAETLSGDSITALVVFIALHLILVLSVFVVGTLEFLGICKETKNGALAIVQRLKQEEKYFLKSIKFKLENVTDFYLFLALHATLARVQIFFSFKLLCNA